MTSSGPAKTRQPIRPNAIGEGDHPLGHRRTGFRHAEGAGQDRRAQPHPQRNRRRNKGPQERTADRIAKIGMVANTITQVLGGVEKLGKKIEKLNAEEEETA